MPGEVRSVALLGTGIMGAPMARNLADAGLTVRAWNRTREKARPLADHGIEIADTPAGAVGAADAVLTMVADVEAVREVMMGRDGALAALTPGSVWLQMSTIGLAGTEEMQALAADAGLEFVDAPVTGSREPAERGELLVFASGPAAALGRSRPVFAALGSRTFELGEAGRGSRMKLVMNSWILALTTGLAESIALAEELSLDPAEFLAILDGSPMGPAYAQLKGKAMVNRSFEPSFPLGHAVKDARLVLEAVADDRLELPLVRSVAQRFAEAAAQGHAEEDMAAVYHAYARDRAERSRRG
jgi:3-hydroxyisobutyrate dehydrogenase